MNFENTKAMLLQAGANEAELSQIDFEKIEEIVSSVNSIDELCAKMAAYNPSFDEKDFKAALAEAQKEQAENAENAEALSDDDLESVAGGSSGNWFKKNKEWLVPLVIVGVGVGTRIGYSLYTKRRYGVSSSSAAASEDNQAGLIPN